MISSSNLYFSFESSSKDQFKEKRILFSEKSELKVFYKKIQLGSKESSFGVDGVLKSNLSNNLKLNLNTNENLNLEKLEEEGIKKEIEHKKSNTNIPSSISPKINQLKQVKPNPPTTLNKKPENMFYRKILNIEITNLSNKHLLFPEKKLQSGRDSLNEVTETELNLKKKELLQKSFSVILNEEEIFVSDGVGFIFQLPFIISLEIPAIPVKNKTFSLGFIFKNTDDDISEWLVKGEYLFDNFKDSIEENTSIKLLSKNNEIEVTLYCSFIIKSELFKEDLNLETDIVDF